MCLDCGCGKPNDDHGDPRHITMDRLNDAAKASGIPTFQAVQNIQEGFRQAQADTQNATNWSDQPQLGATD